MSKVELPVSMVMYRLIRTAEFDVELLDETVVVRVELLRQEPGGRRFRVRFYRRDIFRVRGHTERAGTAALTPTDVLLWGTADGFVIPDVEEFERSSVTRAWQHAECILRERVRRIVGASS